MACFSWFAGIWYVTAIICWHYDFLLLIRWHLIKQLPLFAGIMACFSWFAGIWLGNCHDSLALWLASPGRLVLDKTTALISWCYRFLILWLARLRYDNCSYWLVFLFLVIFVPCGHAERTGNPLLFIDSRIIEGFQGTSYPVTRAYTMQNFEVWFLSLDDEPIRGSHFSSFLHILPLNQYNGWISMKSMKRQFFL